MSPFRRSRSSCSPPPPAGAPWRGLATALAALAWLGVATACGNGDVVAEVGKTKLRQAELQAAQAGKGRTADPQAALDAMVERALAAEAARKAGLDEKPAVKARLATAAREVLAQAYLDQELAGATREDALRARYDASKEKLARRRIHVAHLVARVEPGKPGARAAAESLVSRAAARLAAGDPFEKVARDVSQDPASGARGGDLGAILEGQIDQPFFEAAARLKPGQPAALVESPFGLHLVKAVEAADTVTPSFEEARSVLAAEARREAETALRQRLRREIDVTVHRERIPAAAGAPGPAGPSGPAREEK